MLGSALTSIFFVLACLVAGLGLFLVRKSAKTLPAIAWGAASILTLTCWHALLAGLFTLVHLPVTIVSLGVADLIAGGVLWWVIRRQRAVQQYDWHAIDTVVAAVLAVYSVAYFMVRTDGLNFSPSYLAIDPAPRLLDAVDVVNTHAVQGMYYQSLTNGLLISTLSPLMPPDYYYKIFVFGDGLFLFIGGLMFYAVIRRHLKTTLMLWVGLGMTVIYLSGYPLNSTLFGFTWLGMGVILITYLTFLADSLASDEVGKWPGVALLMGGSLGLFVCYSMFAPVVFVALALLLLWKYHGRWVVSRSFVLAGLAVFLLPCAIGVVYLYSGTFTGGVTVSGAISAEGAGYRDLFSNFLPFAPIAAFGVGKMLRSSQVNLQLIMLPVQIVFMVGLFAMGMFGKVSSYYYYKSYYVLWFIMAYLAIVGISKIANHETAVLLGTYATVWLVVLAVAMSGLEHRIQVRNELFDQQAKSIGFNDVLMFNRWEILQPRGIDPDQQALYHYVYANCVVPGEPMVPVVSSWQNVFWYEVMSAQRDNTWLEATVSNPGWVLSQVKQSTSACVLVLTDGGSVAYQANRGFYDGLPKVYSNGAGFVASLPGR